MLLCSVSVGSVAVAPFHQASSMVWHATVKVGGDQMNLHGRQATMNQKKVCRHTRIEAVCGTHLLRKAGKEGRLVCYEA